MEAATTAEEMNMTEELNQDRNNEQITSNSDSSSGPNIVIYIFMVGLVGLPGDLLKLIPILGAILAFPFYLGMCLWRACSSRFKKSPLQKILTTGLLQGIPFTNTLFLTSCYIEETKLGKTIINKVAKPLKMTGN